MRYIGFILIILTCTSCLKKIQEVETANTNIFDPDYAGDQWWVYEDVFLWTNSNNDQFIRMEFSISDTIAPDLKPTSIDISASVNGASPIITTAPRTINGNYEGAVDINPTSATNFCLEIGVYVDEEELTINKFTECKDL